jgi:hypothetical protein
MVLYCIHHANDDKDILRRLLKLYQEDEIEKIKEVRIVGTTWDDDDNCMFTENVVVDIVRTFRHISSKGIKWDLLSVYDCKLDHPQFQSLLSQICKLDLFRAIEFQMEDEVVLTEQKARVVVDAMKNNSKLEKVHIQGFHFSGTCSPLLCEGLKARNQTLKELSFLNASFEEPNLEQPLAADAASYLVSGLQNSEALRRFIFYSCDAFDSEWARILKALEGHPTLEHLEFGRSSLYFDFADVHTGDYGETMKCLASLLSLPTCKVRSLRLNARLSHREKGILHLFLEGLKQNKTLERLVLNHCRLDHHDLSNLLRNLWKFQKLTHLDLSGNRISKFPVLDASVFVNMRQSKLTSLDLELNPALEDIDRIVADEEHSSLLQLVMSAPRLGYIATPLLAGICHLFNPQIRLYLDWNRCGRKLRNTGHEKALPLSLWPMVFARASDILQEDRNAFLRAAAFEIDSHRVRYPQDRCPNVIYQLFRDFLCLNSGVLSTGNQSHVDNRDGAEPREKRQRLLGSEKVSNWTDAEIQTITFADDSRR